MVKPTRERTTVTAHLRKRIEHLQAENAELKAELSKPVESQAKQSDGYGPAIDGGKLIVRGLAKSEDPKVATIDLSKQPVEVAISGLWTGQHLLTATTFLRQANHLAILARNRRESRAPAPAPPEVSGVTTEDQQELIDRPKETV